MADEAEDRPVLVGVIALVGVGLVVGLIVGLVALGGTRFLGLSGGGGGGGGGAAEQPTLFLPEPTLTESPTGPLITLTPEGEGSTAPVEPEEPAETETTEAAEPTITLQASRESAGPMERVDLSGTYTSGDGAILTVQRLTDGSWNDVGGAANVADELFTTYVELGRQGDNVLRVIDSATGLESNEVTVVIQ